MSFQFSNWFVMTSVAAGFAAGLHLIPAIISAWRVKKTSGLIFLLIFPIYTFVSGFWYSLFLSLVITLTYFAASQPLDHSISAYWGLGLGFFYIILKAIIQMFIR